MTLKLIFLRAGVAALALAAPEMFSYKSQAHAQTQATQSPYDIPALPLNEALVRFSQVTGLDVVVDQDLVKGKRSTAVRGAMAAESALQRMLAGTGLSARVTADGVVIRREPARAPAAQPVRVAPVSSDETLDSAAQEIIVTAQRRAEDGQDVPVAVTAFNAEAIDRLGLDTLRDVSRVAPGLFVSAFNFTSPTVAIRGATNTFTQIGANKPVQIVLDDVFIPRNSAANFELFGLNRSKFYAALKAPCLAAT
jgi:iron complex outermembrane receptor protein